jgi:hypothetical protein
VPIAAAPATAISVQKWYQSLKTELNRPGCPVSMLISSVANISTSAPTASASQPANAASRRRSARTSAETPTAIKNVISASTTHPDPRSTSALAKPPPTCSTAHATIAAAVTPPATTAVRRSPNARSASTASTSGNSGTSQIRSQFPGSAASVVTSANDVDGDSRFARNGAATISAATTGSSR